MLLSVFQSVFTCFFCPPAHMMRVPQMVKVDMVDMEDMVLDMIDILTFVFLSLKF